MSEYLSTLRVARTSSRHLPDPADDRITITSNGREWGMSIRMASELHEALYLILHRGSTEYKNEPLLTFERLQLEARPTASRPPSTRPTLEDI